MYSFVDNIKGLRVEHLSTLDTVLDIGEDSGNIIYNDGAASIPLASSRQYQISEIRLMLDLFENTDTNKRAYPKFEQFAFEVAISASVGNSANTGRQPLFNSLLFGTSDGISDTLVIREEFKFQTNAYDDNLLIFNFTNNGCRVDSFTTGIIVPPAAGQVINIRGLIKVEGLSYPIDKADNEINKY